MKNSSTSVGSRNINTADSIVENSQGLGKSTPNFSAVRSFLSTRPAIRRNPDLINTGVTHALFHPTLGIIPLPGWLVREQFQFLNQASPLTPSMDHRLLINPRPTNVLADIQQLITPDPPFNVDEDPRVAPPTPRVYGSSRVPLKVRLIADLSKMGSTM